MKYLLITVALFEAGTGLVLLFLPSVVLLLLFGLRHALPETLLLGRVAGAALLSIGVSSWLARNDNRSGAQLGLVISLLIYNLTAAVILGLAGMLLGMAGIMLWPAVLFHAAAAIGCFVSLKTESNSIRQVKRNGE